MQTPNVVPIAPRRTLANAAEEFCNETAAIKKHKTYLAYKKSAEYFLQFCGKPTNGGSCELFRWEPPASAGGAELQFSEKASDPKVGFSPGNVGFIERLPAMNAAVVVGRGALESV